MNKQNIKQQLRRTFSAPAIVIALVIGTLCALPKAQADQPAPVSGTFTVCGHNIWDSLHIAGRNLTIDVYQNQIFYAIWSGRYTSPRRIPSTMWSGLPTTVLRCSVYISTAAEPSRVQFWEELRARRR
jgi:hypothetical protein